MSEIDDYNEKDILKILVATDIHLGYGEKDTVRGEDSFIAFDEILQHAQENEVDFILLGGDLFHDANPSTYALQRCLQSLRTYTLGDKPISFEILSDQSMNFSNSVTKTVNYEDPNLNVSIPVFSIHGNHDDPSNFGRLSSMDLLSTCGLLNYFGKWVDLTKINIKPILFGKGETKLALYGLSHIHDVRLARLFHDSKVLMENPSFNNNNNDSDDESEWFSLMVLHQNRADRGPKNYLPEEILPEFLDLVIWGHEHDCRIDPEQCAKKKIFISQPGSSVATSLSQGESITKHCGLLLIHKKQFKMEKIRLQTVRPFIFETINLTEYYDELGLDCGDVQEKVQTFITEKIESMLQQANEKLTSHPKQPKLPLLRLRVHYKDDEHIFNAIRFGLQYSNKVANPTDMLVFKRFKKTTKSDLNPVDQSNMNEAFKKEMEQNDTTKIEDIVNRYFKEANNSQQLQILSPAILSEMCRRLVDQEDNDAADCLVNFYKDKACDYLNSKLPDFSNINDELLSFCDNSAELYKESLAMLDNRGNKKQVNRAPTVSSGDDIPLDKEDSSHLDILSSDDEAIQVEPPKKAASTRGKQTENRARGRGSRGGRTAAAIKKPELNITRTSNRQQSVSSFFSQQQKSKNSNIVYDNSDSD